MSLVKLVTLLLLPAILASAASDASSFTYHGFKSTNLALDGLAQIEPDGLLALSNLTSQQSGHAFYPEPLMFKNHPNSSAFSFSTYFVFGIVPQFPPAAGSGMAFVLAPTKGLPRSASMPYLGLVNESNNGNASNHIVAVELDIFQHQQLHDINDNHVGVDINGLVSVVANPAGYYDEQTGLFQNLTLKSGLPMQLWIEYDGVAEQLNVTLAPLHAGKPSIPLLSKKYNLSPVVNQNMYVGFSAATVLTWHCVLGWSFKVNGPAELLNLSHLPELPRIGPKKPSTFLAVGLTVICTASLMLSILGISYYARRRGKFSELLEEWEADYTPHRFTYRDLYVATKGFKDEELLGSGGFGKVYRGVMPDSGTEIAVKRVSHESKQGMKEFVAEIVSIGRLRHRNLVPLLGYCRRKGELLLVYEYMPNGSLDKFLHDDPKTTLSWDHRFRAIKGVASGLLYLHEGWEKVVIHRDIKASNVLIDDEYNARLGDFGLSRLYDHGSNPQTTHVVGTLGYLAPEHTRTGKATPSTDVYAFGAFLLEVACGRRPVEPKASSEKAVLVDWVFALWSQGEILGAVDPNLGSDYVKEEAELVLKLGLLCSHSRPDIRPGVRHIMLYLEGEVAVPELSSLGVCANGLAFGHCEGFDDFKSSYPSTTHSMFTGSSSVANSIISTGR